MISKKIEIIQAAKILKEIPLEFFELLPIYNHPNFLQLVAPGKSFYAKATNSKGQIAYFPFAGQNLILKWRIFQIAFCQKFKPFYLNGEPDSEHWHIWLEFLKEKTINCQWPTEFLPEFTGGELIKIENKTNQILSLDSDFESLMVNWKSNRKSALNKSKRLTVSIQNDLDFMIGLRKSLSYSENKRWKPTEKEIHIAGKISDSDFFKHSIYRYAVLENDQILNSVLLLKWNGRIHYLFSFSSDEGFKKEALSRFFYCFLESQSNQKTIFDFEGSSIPGISSFFSSLGGVSENYFVLKI